MLAGWWRQHELSDGTYDFDDLLDAHEALDLMAENEDRAREAAKAQEKNRTAGD